MELRMPGKRSKSLPPIRPNNPAEDEYRAKLDAAVDLMVRSYRYWLRSRYRDAHEANLDAGLIPDLAQDAKPKSKVNRLFGELDTLQKRWQDYFGNLAQKLAQGFVDQSYKANVRGWNGQ